MATANERHTTDYLVTPELGSGPGVLVLHSGRGHTQFIKQLCARLAREGFVTLAPDLFDGATPTTTDEAQRLKNTLDAKQTRRRLEDSVAFLQQHDSVSRRQIGVIGIGYGAEIACDISGSLDTDTGCLVLFYGYSDRDWTELTTPVLGHFAALDHEIPSSKISDLRATFQEHDIPHDLFEYSQTEPSFFETEETARHSPQAAQLAWERTVRFLQNELQAR